MAGEGSLKVECPYCGYRFNVYIDDMLALSVKCKSCDRVFIATWDGKSLEAIDPL